LFLASSVLESARPVSELATYNIPTKNVYLFDQRHFAGQNCPLVEPCCGSKLTTTLQEILAKKVRMSHHYSEGATVLLHAIALALLLDSKKVDIFGADLPLVSKSYTYGGKPAEVGRTSFLTTVLKRLRIAISIKPGALFRLASERAGAALLGSKAPSVFAHDFLDLFCDLQYLSDCGAILGCELRAFGADSNLIKIAGISQIT
jgi:hypothetical protein